VSAVLNGVVVRFDFGTYLSSLIVLIVLIEMELV